jgi:hypothetical protein
MDYGVSIEKTVLFRDFQQPFANVYYYREPGVVVAGQATLDALLDFIVAKEKAFHGVGITFMQGRIWTTNTGSRETNVMQVQRNLSGTGALANLAGQTAEMAYLIQWPAGLSVRNKPVYLRKWYHTKAHPPGQTLDSAQLSNQTQMSSAQRNAIATPANDLRSITVLNATFDLIAKSGRNTTGPAVCHRYFEHHQLGDQWR